MEIAFATATDLCARLRSGELSSTEVLSHFIERVERLDVSINAVPVRDFDRAREAARDADHRRASGAVLGPLHGLPLTVKESFRVAGLPTTWGLEPHRANMADTDAAAVAKLKDAGAIVFGKTNVPSAVADQQSFNPVYGTTSNPWDLQLTPGGSSGGSAAALAAGFTAAELGTDLAGSLRVPAHFCGVYCHRPSFGIVPQSGHSLTAEPAPADVVSVGPMARSAADLALLFDALIGPDPLDAPGWRVELPAPRARSLRDFRVAVLPTHPAAEVDSGIADAIRALAGELRRAGATVDENVALPVDLEACQHDFLLATRTTGMRHMAPDALRALAGDPATLDPADRGYRAAGRRAAAMTHRDWHALNERRHAARLAWREFFRSFDVVLCPAHCSLAFPHDASGDRASRVLQINGRTQDYNASSFWLAIAGLSYLPASVRPIGVTRGLPVGVQVIGPYLEDRTVLRFVELLEGICPPVRHRLDERVAEPSRSAVSRSTPEPVA